MRAGFGGFKNRPAVSDSTFLGGNFPFQGYVARSNGLVDNPGSAAGGIPTQFIQTQDPVWKVPTSYQWNATVQRALPWESTVEVQYVGRVGLWLERTRNLNQLPVGTCPLGNLSRRREPQFAGAVQGLQPDPDRGECGAVEVQRSERVVEPAVSPGAWASAWRTPFGELRQRLRRAGTFRSTAWTTRISGATPTSTPGTSWASTGSTICRTGDTKGVERRGARRMADHRSHPVPVGHALHHRHQY